mgnify:CR=1 FL=1
MSTPSAPEQATSLRTHLCGMLRPEHVGQTVTVCGWAARRREHGEHLAFIDLRDHSGLLQCVVDGAHDIRSEYVLAITGTVRPRPEGTVNEALANSAEFAYVTMAEPGTVSVEAVHSAVTGSLVVVIADHAS